jgi:peroxiredoxin
MPHDRRAFVSLPLLAFVGWLALAAAGGLRAQQPAGGDPIAQLREIVNRETLDAAAATARARDVAAWLDATKDRELGEHAVLRLVAGTLVADADAKRRAARELVDWFRTHDAVPFPGFAEPAGRAVLFDVVHRADAGAWAECEELLPVLLRAYAEHRSVFWLLGRRGRDAGTPEGTQFLQQRVIPALLADHTLDDAERVQVLRQLYRVDYTGPKPFTDIAGPTLDGATVRTADHRGRVLLVDYWATWCQPCLLALPGVVAAHRRFHTSGLDVVTISIDEQGARARVVAKVAELELPFPVVFDGKGWKSELAVANKVLAVPATFLIDRKGRVRFTGLEGEELSRRIAELLAEQ